MWFYSHKHLLVFSYLEALSDQVQSAVQFILLPGIHHIPKRERKRKSERVCVCVCVCVCVLVCNCA